MPADIALPAMSVTGHNQDAGSLCHVCCRGISYKLNFRKLCKLLKFRNRFQKSLTVYLETFILKAQIANDEKRYFL